MLNSNFKKFAVLAAFVATAASAKKQEPSPVDQTPVEQAPPTEQTPVNQAPALPAPVVQEPAQKAPVEQVPVQQPDQNQKKQKPTAQLETRITVEGVNISNKHQYPGPVGKMTKWLPGRYESCKAFSGTFDGNEVHFKVSAKGGAGGYTHQIVTSFNDKYQLGQKRASQVRKKRAGNGTFSVTLPELTDKVPFTQQTVLLLTTDKDGNTAHDSVMFTVSRPVIVNPSGNPAMRQTDCRETYLPYESMTGPLMNATNNLSMIQVKQGLDNIWTSTRGWQFGVFVSPLSPLGLGNLIVFNFTYFRETSKTIRESTEVMTQYNFDPGDYVQVYTQPTRFVTAYDATLVEPCGEQTLVPGAYHFQTWGFSHLVYPINPTSKTPPALSAIGAPAINTCEGTPYNPVPGKTVDVNSPDKDKQPKFHVTNSGSEINLSETEKGTK